MHSYNCWEKQTDAKPDGLLAWETVLNSTQDYTLTISRINPFWTTRNELLEPNGREIVFDSIDTFSPRLGWRHHKLILTRPPNELARVKSGPGSRSYQGNRNLLSAIHLTQNKAFIFPRAATARSPPCFAAGGPTRCLLPFATLQVVQKVRLFIGNVAVASAWFCCLFSQRPEALWCKLKCFSAFSPGCSASFDHPELLSRAQVLGRWQHYYPHLLQTSHFNFESHATTQTRAFLVEYLPPPQTRDS